MTLMIVGPESPYFLACARIFRSHAALATSPLIADAASLLMANSIRDAFFTLPRSRNSVLAFKTFVMISPTCRVRVRGGEKNARLRLDKALAAVTAIIATLP